MATVLDRKGEILDIGDTVVIVHRLPYPQYHFAGRRAIVVSLDDSRFGVRVEIDTFKDVPLESFRVHKLPKDYEHDR